jgi:hypothetical protein
VSHIEFDFSCLCDGSHKNGESLEVLGRSLGGFSTKSYVAVDGLGNPLRLHLTAGQRHDIIKAHDLIVDLDFDAPIADCSYEAKAFVDELIAHGIEPVIPMENLSTTVN